MDAATFRTDFPEFADVAVYPDATVTLWMNVGVARMNQQRWTDAGLYDIGLELFTAHYVVLAVADQQEVAKGNLPTQSVQVLSSVGAGGVSASIDTNIGALARAGSFNLTNYGKRFHELAMIVGMAGAQL